MIKSIKKTLRFLVLDGVLVSTEAGICKTLRMTAANGELEGYRLNRTISFVIFTLRKPIVAMVFTQMGSGSFLSCLLGI